MCRQHDLSHLRLVAGVDSMTSANACAGSRNCLLFAVANADGMKSLPRPLQVQTMWSNLKNTLGSNSEVQAQLSVESAAFEWVQAEFFGLMDQFRTTNNVLKVNGGDWRPVYHLFLEVLIDKR